MSGVDEAHAKLNGVGNGHGHGHVADATGEFQARPFSVMLSPAQYKAFGACSHRCGDCCEHGEGSWVCEADSMRTRAPRARWSAGCFLFGSR